MTGTVAFGGKQEGQSVGLGGSCEAPVANGPAIHTESFPVAFQDVYLRSPGSPEFLRRTNRILIVSPLILLKSISPFFPLGEGCWTSLRKIAVIRGSSMSSSGPRS